MVFSVKNSSQYVFLDKKSFLPIAEIFIYTFVFIYDFCLCIKKIDMVLSVKNSSQYVFLDNKFF